MPNRTLLMLDNMITAVDHGFSDGIVSIPEAGLEDVCYQRNLPAQLKDHIRGLGKAIAGFWRARFNHTSSTQGPPPVSPPPPTQGPPSPPSPSPKQDPPSPPSPPPKQDPPSPPDPPPTQGPPPTQDLPPTRDPPSLPDLPPARGRDPRLRPPAQPKEESSFVQSPPPTQDLPPTLQVFEQNEQIDIFWPPPLREPKDAAHTDINLSDPPSLLDSPLARGREPRLRLPSQPKQESPFVQGPPPTQDLPPTLQASEQSEQVDIFRPPRLRDTSRTNVNPNLPVVKHEMRYRAESRFTYETRLSRGGEEEGAAHTNINPNSLVVRHEMRYHIGSPLTREARVSRRGEEEDVAHTNISPTLLQVRHEMRYRIRSQSTPEMKLSRRREEEAGPSSSGQEEEERAETGRAKWRWSEEVGRWT